MPGDKSLAVLNRRLSFEIFSCSVGSKTKRKLFETMTTQQTQRWELMSFSANRIYTFQALHDVTGHPEGEMLEGLQQPQFLYLLKPQSQLLYTW